MGRVSKSFALLIVSMFLIVSLAATTVAEQGGGNFFTTLISPSQTENTITLSWTPLPAHERNWLFNGYEVFCLKSVEGWQSLRQTWWQSCWKSEYGSSPQNNVTIIRGLSPNTTYYFKVVPHGFDSYGHGPFPESNILEVKTQPAITPSSTQTPSPTPTPTIPEFSWLMIPLLFLSILSIAVIVRLRKT